MVEESGKKLTIGVHEFKPLVYKKGNTWTGFEVELWEKIAEKEGFEYEFVENKDFGDLLGKLTSGEYDMAMSGITRTPERGKRMRMSFLTLDTGLGIASLPLHSFSFKDLLKGFFTKQTSIIFFVLVLAALVNAHIFWLIERGGAISENYLLGIVDSFYYSIVTFSTVGYGDIVAVSFAGKVFSIISILTGLAIFGLYLGQISSALTLGKTRAKISSPEEITGKKIGVKRGTTSLDAVKEKNGQVQEFNDIEGAILALEKQTIDAVVSDLPVLQNLQKEKKSFSLSGGVFARQTYAFMFPKKQGDEKIIETINQDIISVRENEEYDTLYDKYFK